MFWIAAVLGLFFFYCFVERAHKIVFLKLIIGLGIIGVLGGTAYYFFGKVTEYQKSRWISVSLENVAVDPAMKASIFEELYSKGVRDDEFKKLFTGKLDDYPQELKKILAEVVLGTGVDFYDGFVHDWLVAMKKGPEEANYFCVGQALAKALEAISKQENQSLRDVFQDITIIFGLSVFCESAAVSDLIPLELRRSVKHFDEIHSDLEFRLDRLLTERKGYQAKFKVCNNRKMDLQWFIFSVSGFREGRSTRYALDSQSSSTVFSSDEIVAAKTCKDIEFKGGYKVFDRYEVSDINGDWGN